jgi:hypothetical protein
VIRIDGRDDLNPLQLAQHPRVQGAHVPEARDQSSAWPVASVWHVPEATG